MGKMAGQTNVRSAKANATQAGYAVAQTGDVAAGQKLIEAEGHATDSNGLYEKGGKTLELPIIVDNDNQELILSNNELADRPERLLDPHVLVAEHVHHPHQPEEGFPKFVNRGKL